MAARTALRRLPATVTRTCAGCGGRAAKHDLLRVVAVGEDLIPDPAARMLGRGAYLHPSQGCWERARRRRAFARALRLHGPPEDTRLAEYLGKFCPAGQQAGRDGPGQGRGLPDAPEKAG